MSQADSEFWMKARHVQDKLADQFLDHPDVSLIDIGYDLDPESGGTTERIVVRVHVRRPRTREALGLPPEIDGVPIRVVTADYRIE